ncbi:MAG: hypothetical protein IJ735_07895 [Clostridia bacterium]|nr:hypothetical protein [Clostridia bacterium]
MKRKSNVLLSGILSLFLVATVFTATACGSTATTAALDAGSGEQTETTATETETTTDTSEATETETSETAEQYVVNFVTDEHVTVTVYHTQDVTGSGTKSASAVARSGDTGGILTDGTGQVNYVLTFDDGYELASIEASPTGNFNKNKADPEAEGNADYYRLTKITGDVTVTVTSQAIGAEEDLTQGYRVNFVTDGHATITVYNTQKLEDGTETTVAYSRDGKSGLLTKTNGQINFVITFDDGYELSSVEATPDDNYNKLNSDPEKDGSANYYRLTKVTGEVTITVTTQAK